jgi:hypothetical protein
MPTPIRFVEVPPLRQLEPENGSRYCDGTVDFDKFAVGDMAYYHYRGEPLRDPEQLRHLHLTAHYFAHNAGRPPLILALPDKSSKKLYFLVDGQCYSNRCTRCGKSRGCKCGEARTPRGYYDGWTVTGAPPLITVHPSVNFDDDEYQVKRYHGFIQKGIIGDG